MPPVNGQGVDARKVAVFFGKHDIKYIVAAVKFAGASRRDLGRDLVLPENIRIQAPCTRRYRYFSKQRNIGNVGIDKHKNICSVNFRAFYLCDFRRGGVDCNVARSRLPVYSRRSDQCRTAGDGAHGPVIYRCNILRGTRPDNGFVFGVGREYRGNKRFAFADLHRQRSFIERDGSDGDILRLIGSRIFVAARIILARRLRLPARLIVRLFFGRTGRKKYRTCQSQHRDQRQNYDVPKFPFAHALPPVNF